MLDPEHFPSLNASGTLHEQGAAAERHAMYWHDRLNRTAVHTGRPVGDRVRGANVLDQVLPRLHEQNFNERARTVQKWMVSPAAPARERELARFHRVSLPEDRMSPVGHLYKQLLREVHGTETDPDKARARTMQEYERLYNLPTVGETSALYGLSGGQYGQRGPISSLIMHGAVQLDLMQNRKRAMDYSQGNFYRGEANTSSETWQGMVGGLDAVTNLVINTATYQFMTLPAMQFGNVVRDALFYHGTDSKPPGMLVQSSQAGNQWAKGTVRLAGSYEKAYNWILKNFTAPVMEDTILVAAKGYDALFGKAGDKGLSHWIEQGIDDLRDPHTSPAEKAVKSYQRTESALRSGNLRALGAISRPMEAFRVALFGDLDGKREGLAQIWGSTVYRRRMLDGSAPPLRTFRDALGASLETFQAVPQDLGYSGRVSVGPDGQRTFTRRWAGLNGFRGGSAIVMGGFVAVVMADFVIGRLDRMGRVNLSVQRQVENALNPLTLAAGRSEMTFLPTPGRGDNPSLGIIDPVYQLLRAASLEKFAMFLPTMRLAWKQSQGEQHTLAGNLQQAAILTERAKYAERIGDSEQAKYLYGLARMAPNAAMADGGAGVQSTSWAFQVSPFPLLGTLSLAARESSESDPATGMPTTFQRFAFSIQGPVQMEIGSSIELPVARKLVYDRRTRQRSWEWTWDPTEKFSTLMSGYTTAYGLYSIMNAGYKFMANLKERQGGGRSAPSLFHASGKVGKWLAAPFLIKAAPLVLSVWTSARLANSWAAQGAGAIRRAADPTRVGPAWGDMPGILAFSRGLRDGNQGMGYRVARTAGRAAGVVTAAAAVAGLATAAWGYVDMPGAMRFMKRAADGAMAFGRFVGGGFGESVARAAMTYFPYWYESHPDYGSAMRKDPFGSQNLGTRTRSYPSPGEWVAKQFLDPLKEFFTVDPSRGKFGPLYLGTGARFVSFGPFGVAERQYTRDETYIGTSYIQVNVLPFQPGSAAQISRAVTSSLRNTDAGRFDVGYLNNLLAMTDDPNLRGRRMIERKSPIIMGTMWHTDSAVFDVNSMATSFEIRRRMAMADWIRHVDAYDVWKYRENPQMIQWRVGNHTFDRGGTGVAKVGAKLHGLLKSLKSDDMQGNFAELEADFGAYDPFSDVIYGRPSAAKAPHGSLLNAMKDQAFMGWGTAILGSGIGLGAAIGIYAALNRKKFAEIIRDQRDFVPKSGVHGFNPLTDFHTGANTTIRGFMFTIGNRAYTFRPQGTDMSPLMTLDEAKRFNFLYSQSRGLWEVARGKPELLSRGKLLHTAVQMESLLHMLRKADDPNWKSVFNQLGDVKAFIKEFRIWHRGLEARGIPAGQSVGLPEELMKRLDAAGHNLKERVLTDFGRKFNLQVASPGLGAQMYGQGLFGKLWMRMSGGFMGIVDDLWSRASFTPVLGGSTSFVASEWQRAAMQVDARRFNLDLDDVDDLAALYKLHATAAGGNARGSLFDTTVSRPWTTIDPVEYQSYRENFWRRADTAGQFTRNQLGAGARAGLSMGWKGFMNVSSFTYLFQTGVSSSYLLGGMMDTSLRDTQRIRMGSEGFTEATSLGIATLGSRAISWGVGRLAGLGVAALVTAGILAAPVTIPAAVITAIGAVIGIGASIAFDSLVGNTAGWRNLTSSIARWSVSAQRAMGQHLERAVSGFGWSVRMFTEMLQDGVDGGMTWLMKSDQPEWVKGAANGLYNWAKPLSDRALHFFNPHGMGKSLSFSHPLFRQSPIWHGTWIDAGKLEIAQQERVRMGASTGAMFALFPPSLFSASSHDQRLEIPLREMVGSKAFFKPDSPIDEYIEGQMRSRAIMYQQFLGKFLNRTEAARQGKQLGTIADESGLRIDREGYGLAHTRSAPGESLHNVRNGNQPVTVTSTFGMRLHPITKKEAFHRGIDKVVHTKDRLYRSQVEGEVVYVGEADGFGSQTIVMRVGKYNVVYGHNEKAFVKKGDKVLRGSLLLKMGSEGQSTRAHIHEQWHLHQEGVNVFLQPPVNPETGFADVKRAHKHDHLPAPNAGGTVKRPMTTTTVVPNALPPKPPSDPAAKRSTMPMGERKVIRKPNGEVTISKHQEIGSVQAATYMTIDTAVPQNRRSQPDTILP